mmetsp:Transcript_36147/g.41241  ORF Transcript_36147/g.41241 Transcript_36147/m.41241 type:complete len:185 (-) Transcript_36147:324-878(-)
MRQQNQIAIFLSLVMIGAVDSFTTSSAVLPHNYHQNQKLSSSHSRTIHQSTAEAAVDEDEVFDFDVPEDAVICIKPKAMTRLRELVEKQKNKGDGALVLRMGVRNGGCSGLSYVMDFSTEEEIQDDDAVDDYPKESIKCVVDAKSMLYLYGLELDFSDELIGGGFKFFNPNAEESCGCGSSFGV